MDTATVEINGDQFYRGPSGSYVPAEAVKEIDRLRDDLVRELVAKAKGEREQLQIFKAESMENLKSFITLSLEKYGVKQGGKKGNVTFYSYDGKYKIQINVHEFIRFDEQLIAAKELIDECLLDWSKGANSNLMVLINDAFKVNKQGNIDTRRVLSLRKLEISDTRWQNAMEAIGQSLCVQQSKEYIRFYEQDDQGGYLPVSLDIAAL